MPNVAGASGVVGSDTFFQAATKIVNKTYLKNQIKAPSFYPRIFSVVGNDKSRGFMTFLPIVELGLFPVRPEFAGPAFDNPGEGLATTYNFVCYSLAYKISKEGLRRDPMGLIRKMPAMLSFSEQVTKDELFIQMLNLGFTNFAGGGYNLADGQPLFSSSHPLGGGTIAQYGTQSNLVGAASISPESINQVDILYQTLLSDRGNPSFRTPRKMIAPPQQRKIAEETLGSSHAPDSNDNRINTAFEAYELIICRYLTSTTAWFVTSANGGEDLETDTHSMIVSFQWQNETTTWSDPGTGNFNQKAEFCCTYGPADFRGAVGSLGA